MPYIPKSEEDKARAITSLVDGTASERQRAALEEWAAGHPEIAREVEKQRQVAHDLRTGGPPIPPRLLGQVRERARAADRHEQVERGRPGWSTGGWAAGIAAAAVVV